MPELTVNNIQVNQRYRITYERGATKGVTGYKIEANGDDMVEVIAAACTLRQVALKEAGGDNIATVV